MPRYRVDGGGAAPVRALVGDVRRVHRRALSAWAQRASGWRHEEVEPAAHDLLLHLDGTSA